MTVIDELKRRIEIKREELYILQDDIAVLQGLIKQEEEKIKKGAEEAPRED